MVVDKVVATGNHITVDYNELYSDQDDYTSTKPNVALIEYVHNNRSLCKQWHVIVRSSVYWTAQIDVGNTKSGKGHQLTSKQRLKRVTVEDPEGQISQNLRACTFTSPQCDNVIEAVFL